MLPKVAKMLPVVVLFFFVGFWVAGCVPTAPTETPVPGAATPAGQPPKYGGILNVAWTTEAPYLDPHMDPASNYERLLPYSKLMKLGPNLELVPDLAESWDVSKDGLTLTFHLRKGVKFCNKPPVNGREMTAEDVVYSLKRVGTGTAEFPRGYLVEPIKKYETPDPYTVVLKLDEPFAPVMSNLASTVVAVVPKEMVQKEGDLKKVSCGTGPFQLESYEPKVIWRLRKHQDYFIKGRPYLDGVDQIIMPDNATQIAAFRAGKLDTLRGRFTWADAEQVKKTNPEMTVLKPAPYGNVQVWLNLQRPPLNDVRVRRAISLALDRQAFNELIDFGKGTISGIIPPVHRDFARPQEELLKMPGWRQPKDQDIAEAKRLLAEAGYPKGFKIESMAQWSGAPYQPLLAEQLAKVGIEVKVANLEIAESLARAQNNDFEMHMDSGKIFEEIDEHLTGRFRTGVGRENYTRYSNPKADSLMDKQRKTMDKNERKKIIREIEDILLEDVPTVPLYQTSLLVMVPPYVKNYGENQLGLPFFRFYHFFDEIWLDK